VSFLLDTGAPISVIHPQDMKAMGLDTTLDMRDRPLVHGRGIGGETQHFTDEAIVSFEHADGSIVGYRFEEMRFAVPTDYNADFPSLLGMDFIGAFELVLNSNEERIELR
jgi:hypothetical protein